MRTKLQACNGTDSATPPATITASRISIDLYGTDASTSDRLGFMAMEWFPTFHLGLGV